MLRRNQFWRTSLLLLIGLILLASLTGCPKVVPKVVRKNIPGASGDSKLQVLVHVSGAANKNNPVAVDVVLVSDKKLLKELMKMSASKWFAERHQLQLDYPKETDLNAGSWEWVPGQVVKLDRLPVRLEIVGGVVFANYITPGAHRAAINPRRDVLITLGEDDLCVQSINSVSEPCPPGKQ
jgi:type VI secretion system protein